MCIVRSIILKTPDKMQILHYDYIVTMKPSRMIEPREGSVILDHQKVAI